MESIPADLLEILVCPETHQRVKEAPAELIERLSVLQAAGKLKTRGGEPVKEPVRQALLREDGKVAYLVIEGIPVMIVEEGIAVE